MISARYFPDLSFLFAINSIPLKLVVKPLSKFKCLLEFRHCLTY